MHHFSVPVYQRVQSPNRHIFCVKLNFTVTSTFLHLKSQERYLGDTLEMNSSSGLVTVILFLLGKQNASKNVDSFFCYVNKTFNHNFIPELYA